MRLLDLFCGVGGAAMGYHRAGFTDILGIDIKPQPNYPFEFIQGNALAPFGDDNNWLDEFDLIHASPPCQAFTVYGNNAQHVRQDHLNLIPETRSMLQGHPHVIENVPRAPLIDPTQLCGTSFGIEVRRHRLFETNWPLEGLPCDHGRFTERKYPGSSNRPNGRTVCNIGEWRVPLPIQKEVMEMPWVKKVTEISQAIPPAYTEYIGKQFLATTGLISRLPKLYSEGGDCHI